MVTVTLVPGQRSRQTRQWHLVAVVALTLWQPRTISSPHTRERQERVSLRDFRRRDTWRTLAADPLPSFERIWGFETTKSSLSPQHVADRLTLLDDGGSHWYATCSDWVGVVAGKSRV